MLTIIYIYWIQWVLILVSVLLPMTMGLNCYQCSGGSRGCSDPFNKTGADVSTTGTNNSNIYCKVHVLYDIIKSL